MWRFAPLAALLVIGLHPRRAEASCVAPTSCVCGNGTPGFVAEGTLVRRDGARLHYRVDQVLFEADGGAAGFDGGIPDEFSLLDVASSTCPTCAPPRALIRDFGPGVLQIAPIDAQDIVACDQEFFRITRAEAIQLMTDPSCGAKQNQFAVKAFECHDTGFEFGCASAGGPTLLPILIGLGWAIRRRQR